jgi:hypothetical protein
MIVDCADEELIADTLPSVSLKMDAIINNLKSVKQREWFEGRRLRARRKKFEGVTKEDRNERRRSGVFMIRVPSTYRSRYDSMHYWVLGELGTYQYSYGFIHC